MAEMMVAANNYTKNYARALSLPGDSPGHACGKRKGEEHRGDPT